MRERVPAASDSYSSRAAARSQHASPLGSPRSAKTGPFQARLTERQQLALALEESLKAAHAPAHHEAALSDPHRGSFEGEHSSRSRAANSDDESSAEPSAQQRAIPAACSPRKRRRDSDETDLSSTSQSFGRAGITAKEHSSKPVAAPKDVHGAKDKGNSCSESSRQSHSTALPAIRVSPARRVLSESSDSDSPCESPAGSRSAAELDHHSQHSFGHGSPSLQCAAAEEGAVSGASHSQAGASDSPRQPDGNVGPADAASPEVLRSKLSNAAKRGRQLASQDERGSSKRLKVHSSLSPVHDAIPAIRGESEDRKEELTELCLGARPGRSVAQAGKAAPSSVHLHVDTHQHRPSLSHPSAGDAAPDISVSHQGHAGLPDARHISLSNGVRIALSMRPPTSQAQATPRQASVKHESDRADGEQQQLQAQPKAKASMASAGMLEPSSDPPTTSTSSQQQQPAPQLPLQPQPTRRITIRKTSAKAPHPRRSGRVAAFDSPSEPSSPVKGSQSPAFLASPPGSPTKRPQHGSSSPFKPGKKPLLALKTAKTQGSASVRPPLPRGASLDANYTPPGALSRGNSSAAAAAADGKAGPARSSSRAQASLASLQRKLRSQEPLPEAVDPYAKPPVPKRSRAGGLAGACQRLRTSDDGELLSPSRSCSGGPSSPVQLSDSLSKSLAARAASVTDPSEPSTPKGQAQCQQGAVSQPSEGVRVAPQSPFAGGCLPAFADSSRRSTDSPCQLDDSAPPSNNSSSPLVLASSIGHACKSLGDLHSRESVRWDSSVTAATSGSRDTSPARQRASPPASNKQALASWGAGKLEKALRSYAASQEEDPEDVCATGSGTFLKGCRLLCRIPSLDPCIRKAPPPLFRSTSNEQYLQGAYEDMLQRQALERETVDGLQGWLGPDTD